MNKEEGGFSFNFASFILTFGYSALKGNLKRLVLSLTVLVVLPIELYLPYGLYLGLTESKEIGEICFKNCWIMCLSTLAFCFAKAIRFKYLNSI